MHLRKAIAALAVIGLVCFTASLAQAGGGCCAAKAKGTSSASGASGCSAKGASDRAGSCSGMKAGQAGGCSAHASAACTMSAKDCEKMLRTYYREHGWLGIESGPCTGLQTRPAIMRVATGSPAEAAGFRTGDILTSVNGISFTPENELAISDLMLNGFKIGETVRYTAMRGGSIVTLQTKLVPISESALKDMISSHVGAGHPSGEKAEKTM